MVGTGAGGVFGMTDNLEVLAVRDVVRVLDITRQTVYKLIDEGKLKGFRVGNQWRIYKDSLDALVGASAEDTPFMIILNEVFSDEGADRRRVLELRYREGLDRETVSDMLEVTEARVHHLTIDALSALQSILKDNLVYDDVENDEFALRVLAQLFLAQEEG